MNRTHAHDEEEFAGRAQLRAKNQVTLPAGVRQALHIDEGDEVTFTVLPDGQVVLRGMTSIPADQKWFWTEEWQAGERQASAEIVAGDLRGYDDIDDMFDDLFAQTTD